MRYFLELAYNGKNYAGWQSQQHSHSLQAEVEKALSTLLEHPVAVTGCGRTDTGVHARQYFLHFDTEHEPEERFLDRLNRFMNKDFVVYRMLRVLADAHARFDATERSYEYVITLKKNPFLTDFSYYFPYGKPDLEQMNNVAKLLMQYEEFAPFCKSRTDVKTKRCTISESHWIEQEPDLLFYRISANRFLRGMVRLIVGCCLLVGQNKLSVEEFKEVMERQVRFRKNLSVPAQGLFLTSIKYPYIN